MKFELWKSNKDQNWYWRFIASNNREIFRSSEGYVNRADAVNGIALAKGSATAVVFVQQPDGTWVRE